MKQFTAKFKCGTNSGERTIYAINEDTANTLFSGMFDTTYTWEID